MPLDVGNGLTGSGSSISSSTMVSVPAYSQIFRPQKWRYVFGRPTIFKKSPFAWQLTLTHAPYGASSIVPHSSSPMNILTPLSLSPQQSPLLRIEIYVIVTVLLNLDFHHGPSGSFSVWIQVNSP